MGGAELDPAGLQPRERSERAQLNVKSNINVNVNVS